jgi:Flp pilus assembly pilin Flp
MLTKGKMNDTVMRLWREEEGQDLIEYVLLVALIALLVAAAFPNFANAIAGVFTKATNCVSAPSAANC